MKPFLSIFACALGVAGLLASAASAADMPRHNHVCIQTSNIDGMSYPDNHTIIFRMKGGPVRVWRNVLPRECPGLKFEQGIVWQIWGDEVCSNMQVFYVIRRGTPCMLGAFEPVEAPPAGPMH